MAERAVSHHPGEVWVACNLCGSADHAILFTATQSAKQVVRCRRCGMVFYNPQPSPSQVAALYSSEYFAREFPGELVAEQTRLAHGRLARIESELGVGSLLDVGCGVGCFLAVARQRGWRAVGMDVAPAAVKVATTASGGPVLLGDLSRPRPAGMSPFDVLSMWDVLEHLADPVGDLRRARHWLRPGGLIVMQTQNVNSVTSAWMRRRWEQFVEFHLYHFSSRTLRLALEQAGFERIRIEASDRFTRGEAATRDEKVPRSAERPMSPRDSLRHSRDFLFVRMGYDPFNIMVAAARCPTGG